MTDALVPMTEMDNAAFAPADQFDTWASHSPNTRLTPVNKELSKGGFLAQGRVWNLGPVLVAATRLDPFVSHRDAQSVRTAPAEHVQIVALHSGCVQLEADGIDQLCTAPDLFVRDYTRPSCATASRIDSTTIYFARDFLAQATGGALYQGALPRSPEASVLGSSIMTLVQNLPGLSAQSAPFYARTLRDMAAAALLNRERPLAAIKTDQLLRAKSYIEARLPGTLSVSTMARDLGMSRTVLYELFRIDGGVLSYDRLRRLRGLYRALLDSSDHRPIATLGIEYGFFDRTGLARCFRDTFGCSPGEIRKRALSAERAGDADPPGTSAAGRIRDAVARLS
jgi:AraC-like DNA-binding protein